MHKVGKGEGNGNAKTKHNNCQRIYLQGSYCYVLLLICAHNIYLVYHI